MPGANGSPKPNWVEIAGCDQKACSIRNKGDVILAAELIVGRDSTAIRVKVTAFILGIPVDYELPVDKQNGCNAFETACPIHAGERHEIGTSFILKAPIVGVTPTIELTLTNQDGVQIMCVRTKIFIAP